MNLKDLQVKIKAAKELAEAQAAEELSGYEDAYSPKPSAYHSASGRAAAYSHILSDIDGMIAMLEASKELAQQYEKTFEVVANGSTKVYWSTRAGLYREILGE